MGGSDSAGGGGGTSSGTGTSISEGPASSRGAAKASSAGAARASSAGASKASSAGAAKAPQPAAQPAAPVPPGLFRLLRHGLFELRVVTVHRHLNGLHGLRPDAEISSSCSESWRPASRWFRCRPGAAPRPPSPQAMVDQNRHRRSGDHQRGICDSTSRRFSSSLLMSILQPSSLAARRTFCPSCRWRGKAGSRPR